MTAAVMDMARPRPASGSGGRGAVAVPVERRSAGHAQPDLDWVAEEVPVSLEYNGLGHAVMLASPRDIADFALGFSLTEGIAASPADILDMEVTHTAAGIRVAMEVTGRCLDGLKRHRRAMAGTTGCGICGTESLERVIRPLPQVPQGGAVSLSRLARGFEQVRSAQSLMALTGATHAAGWMPCDGGLSLSREDVGRHNALDKLIGALARQEGRGPDGGCALVTSRASFEMVQKAAAFGIPILAAISAPTTMAIRVAERLGVTLAGFVRGGACVVYTCPWRLAGTKGDFPS